MFHQNRNCLGFFFLVVFTKKYCYRDYCCESVCLPAVQFKFCTWFYEYLIPPTQFTSIVFLPPLDPPSPVSNLTGHIDSSTLHLSWSAPSDLVISNNTPQYKVTVTPTNTNNSVFTTSNNLAINVSSYQLNVQYAVVVTTVICNGSLPGDNSSNYTFTLSQPSCELHTCTHTYIITIDSDCMWYSVSIGITYIYVNAQLIWYFIVCERLKYVIFFGVAVFFATSNENIENDWLYALLFVRYCFFFPK